MNIPKKRSIRIRTTGVTRLLYKIRTTMLEFESRLESRVIPHSRIKHLKPIRLSLFLIALTLLGVFVLKLTMVGSAAAWYNDNWNYRTKITFGNTGSAVSSQKVKLDIDTATLITAGKMQSDCGDSRFTDTNGIILQYYLDSAGGACNTSSTDYYVLVPTIGVGTTTLYHYYGNPSAVNGTNASQFSESTFSPTSGPTTASEENSPAPALYFKFDEGQGSTTYNAGYLGIGSSAANGTLGTGSSAPTWKTDDQCISKNCLQFDGANDKITVVDTNSLDLSNAGTLQAWIKYHDDNTTLSSFSSWTSVSAPDGADTTQPGDIDAVIVGSKIYYAAFLHVGATSYFSTANSDLDGSNFSSWTAQTAPTGIGNNETTSVAIDSDGTYLYYIGFTHNGTTESIHHTSSNLDGTGFGVWTSFTAPDGAGATWDQSTIDMTIVGNTMYLAAYLHDDATETFSTASIDLDGSNFSGWTSQSALDGTAATYASSVAIDSDGGKLYYAALAVNNTTEVFATATSALDGSSFSGWSSQSAPDGASDINFDGIDMIFAGGKLYYAAYLHSNANDYYYTANANLDGSNFSGWTSQTAPGGIGTGGISIPVIATNNQALYYLALSTNAGTETLNLASVSGLPYHPIFSKSGSYTLVQSANVLTLYWAGTSISASGLSPNNWYHITITHDGSTLTFNVNGTQVASHANTTNFAANANNLYIGTDTSYFFSGEIDEFKIYQYGRSAAEIKQDYISRGSVEGVSAQFGDSGINAKLQNGLVGWWKLDESSGNAADSSGNGLTLTNNNSTSYVTGKFANGSEHVPASSQYLSTATTVNGVKSVSFWVNPDNTTNYYISLTSSAYITSSSGTLSATGFTKPTIYVNGVQTTTIAANTWQFVTVVSDTAINADTFYIGRQSTNYFDGTMDEARLYNRALSPAEVRALYSWAPGPVGYWNLDEKSGTTANDSSGLENSATLTNSPTWTTGKFGSAVALAGSDQQITRADDSDFDFIDDANMTFMTWFKHTTASAQEVILSKYNEAGYKIIMESDGDITCALDYDATWTPTDSATSTAATYDDGNWHHIACVKIADASLNLYIDGVLIATDASLTATNTLTNSDPIYFGIDDDGTSNDFTGSLDDIKIYNYTRTQAQIIEDMNGGHPAVGTPVGSTVLHLSFDEGYGDTVYDSSPYQLHGDMGGSADTCPGDTRCPARRNDGKFGKALYFDGTNDNVVIPYDTAHNLTKYSISLWANYESVPIANSFLIERGQQATNLANLYFWYQPGNSRFVYGFYNTLNSFVDHYYEATITPNIWSHYVLTFDGSTLRLYIDDVLVDEEAETTTPNTSGTQNFIIGANRNRDNEHIGRIDELKVYSFALTSDQIKTEFNQGKAIVLGSLSTGVGGTAPSWAHDRSYCVPGDTSACNTPVGEWKLDEKSGTSAFDTSGNGSTGTFIGSPTWTTGKFGNALNFNGSGDRLDTNYTTNLTTTVTFSMWLNTSVSQSSCTFGICVMMDKVRDGTFENEYVLEYRNLGSGDRIRFTRGFTTTDGAWYINYTLPINTWVHLAVTYDASSTSNDPIIYVNGIPQAVVEESTPVGSVNSESTSFLLGSNRALNVPMFGKLDDVKIYNYVRTPAQIAWDYNKGAPVAWYKFDECQGTTIKDWSQNANGASNGNHGTLTIGATGTNDGAGTCSSGDSSEAWNNGTSGKYNASIDFDGTDDNISVTNTSTIDLNNNLASAHTFSTWIYANSDGENDLGHVYSKNANSPSQTYLRVAGESGGRVNVEAGLDLATSDATVSISAPITINSWNHIAVLYTDDSDDEIEVYVNGRLRGTSTDGSGAPTAESSNLIIGNNAGGDRTFDGKIDDFRIFNYALTPAQIKTIMNNGAVSFR